MSLNNLSAVQIVDTILEKAWKGKASDIHIDPKEEKVFVKLRLDGDLTELDTYSIAIHQEVIARIKVLARLKLDEHYSPQDGRFRIEGHYDVRVVITPSYFGEAAVLRLLRPYDEQTTLYDLGFSHEDAFLIENVLKKPSGMILIAGATGSGKTTTLYTLLHQMLSPERSIVTIEDPIEYILSAARQIAVRGDRMSFAHILRSVLRQDPNIIMVGEMRDQETAKVAVSAALTGHVVLSTIHTRSAASTLTRLNDMGIEKYLVDATVSLVIAQRLVPLLCNNCKYREPMSDIEREFINTVEGQTDFSVYRSRGCEECAFKGNKGRIAVYELLFAGKEQLIKSLIEDGIEKAAKGHISITHVMALI